LSTVVADIRVLVVDDSALIRRFICDAIEAAAGIEVVGTAVNGRDALEKIEVLRPDVVTMDIEMPEMSGLETLPELRRRHPRLPVIMFSTLTVAGAQSTLDALALGASDFVTKPSGPGGLAHSSERVRNDLVPRIRALAPGQTAAPIARPKAPVRPPKRVDCVVIGVSTGGPRALDDVIPMLPADLAVPVLIVQHMPAMFTKMLAERLETRSALQVAEAEQGSSVVRGSVLIAPGGHHMTIERRGTEIIAVHNDDPPEHSCRPSVCVLFRSALHVYGEHLLAVVMTGMGDDGSDAAVAIHESGGQVIVQDEATSVVWGMPGAVVRAGVADRELALAAIAPEIVRRVSVGRVSAGRISAPTGSGRGRAS
jgi:two-component system chemotaxis response regulator CheB